MKTMIFRWGYAPALPPLHPPEISRRYAPGFIVLYCCRIDSNSDGVISPDEMEGRFLITKFILKKICTKRDEGKFIGKFYEGIANKVCDKVNEVKGIKKGIKDTLTGGLFGGLFG